MYDRSESIGGSDAVRISEGKWAKLYDSKHTPDDLSGVLPVQIGHALEPLNRTWFSLQTGIPVAYEEEWTEYPIRHADYPWMAYLPDGLIDDKIPFEAKAVNAFWTETNLIKKYYPQLQHQMRVMNAPHAYLSVFFGNQRFKYFKIPYDPIAADELLRQEELFMWFLTNGQRPPV